MTLVESNVVRLTKRQKKLASRQQSHQPQQLKSFAIRHIEPLTENQRKTFAEFENKNLLLHGSAGTGKTFISLYLSLNEISSPYNDYDKVIIIRSVVPTRDIGFLPGNVKEKSKIYEAPYYSICNELYGRGDAYDILKQKNMIEFQTTSFVRGITFNNCIIILDEMQNCVFQELDSIITRIGKNCKIVFSGDFHQTDLMKDSDKRGLLDFIRIINRLSGFSHIEFNRNDIVRSKIVKDYIIAKEELEIRN